MILNKDIFQEELDEIVSILTQEQYIYNRQHLYKLQLEPKVIDIWTDADSEFHYSLLVTYNTNSKLKIKRFKNYSLVGYPTINPNYCNYCIAIVENEFLNDFLKVKPAFGGFALLTKNPQ